MTVTKHAHTHTHTNTQPFYSSLDFVRDNPGELVSEGTFRHLLDFLMQNEDNTGHANRPDGLPPIQPNWCPNSAISTIFTPDALPGTALPIYPGLGQHQICWLAYPVAWFSRLVYYYCVSSRTHTHTQPFYSSLD